MANLTLYVKDEDMELFERGKQYAKNAPAFRGLSALLAELLREQLESSEEYRDIRLKIGKGLTPKGSGAYRTVTIVGKLVARARTAPGDLGDPTEGWANWDVYALANGRWCALGERWTAEFVGSELDEWADRSYWIVESLDELREIKDSRGQGMPQDLLEVVEDAVKDEVSQKEG